VGQRRAERSDDEGRFGNGIPAGWEAVIGLEVHVQLKTRTKLFSGAPNAFGGEPNTQTTEIDLGMPGVLPVVNGAAVDLAVRAALALGCEVQGCSLFARKHYFYPDLPKGYQISQYEEPLATGGGVPIDLDGASRTVPLVRIHMEEDAGKSIHDPAVTGGGGTHVDLNRAGVPLVEIVSEPEMYTPDEAGAYLRSLRSILLYLDVSDVDMEKGHFRCDANVSVRRAGERELGTKVEIKNLNSFRFVERSLAHEIVRQVEVLEEGGTIEQDTRLWDERAGATRAMRSKEYADDYRYFPDPDLVALRIEPDRVERIRRSLPELPGQRRRRVEEEYGLPAEDARVLTEERDLADFFEAAAKLHGSPKSLANWVMRDLLALLKYKGVWVAETPLTAENFVALLRLVDEGKVTAASARTVLPQLAESGESPFEVVGRLGLEAVSDRAELEAVAKEILEANPGQVEQYRGGETKLLNFFLGQVMKRTGGKANPALVREILAALLSA
jgi:aspartyl-tRNA(Asn)/glutamyl-tRNA(Gln) amidotransferase subunit B